MSRSYTFSANFQPRIGMPVQIVYVQVPLMNVDMARAQLIAMYGRGTITNVIQRS